MDRNDAPYSRRLLLAFAVVTLTFIFGTLYENWRTLEIGEQTGTVAQTALPNLEHLAAASDALRDIEAASARYPRAPEERRPQARAEIEDKWRALDKELTAYVNIEEGERAIYRGTLSTLRSVEEHLRHLYDEVEDGNLAEAQKVADNDLHQAVERADANLQALMTFNTSHAYASTKRIDALRTRATEIAVALDGLAVLVAVAAMAWLLRLFSAHTRLLRQHGELVERRANELEVFGRRVAHDLLSPLSALTYCLGAFKRASESDPALQEALSRARMCVHRAQSMVDGIFEFARAGGRPDLKAKADIREAIEQVAEELRSADSRDRPDIEIDAANAGLAACSRGVLVSVLTNLMRNASKYMNDSPMRKIAIRVRDHERDNFVRIDVEDTGPGIAPELRAVIFEPYVRAEGATQPGLGLGLATVKRLCVAHGGQVGVRSTLGRGSVFWFTLPRPGADDAEEAPPSSLRIRKIG